MIVASMRYGTIRRPTALTTNSFDGFRRHATSAASSGGIVVADIGCSYPWASLRRHQGSEQRIQGPADLQGPTRGDHSSCRASLYTRRSRVPRRVAARGASPGQLVGRHLLDPLNMS